MSLPPTTALNSVCCYTLGGEPPCLKKKAPLLVDTTTLFGGITPAPSLKPPPLGVKTTVGCLFATKATNDNTQQRQAS